MLVVMLADLAARAEEGVVVVVDVGGSGDK